MARKYEEMEKDERISHEIKALRSLYSKIPKNKKKLADGLIQNAAFMKAELFDLQIYIKENGYTEEYQNGKNQWGTKRSPQAEQYNTMVKNYTAIIGKLNDLIPKDKTSTNDIDDGFDDFINDKE